MKKTLLTLVTLSSATLIMALHFDPDRKFCRPEEGRLVPNPNHTFGTITDSQANKTAAYGAQRSFCTAIQRGEEARS